VPATKLLVLGVMLIAPVPPVAVTVAFVVPPLHAIVFADAEIVIAGAWVIVIDVVALQLFASVAVNVYVPADKLFALGVMLIAPVPPVAVTVAFVVPPLQAIVFADAETVIAGDWVIVIDVVALQLFASVAVNV
jgi:hypothetical protein